MNVVFWEYVFLDFFVVIMILCLVSWIIVVLVGLYFFGSFVGINFNYNWF